MNVLAILAALLLFSRWAYVRAERARCRDIAVQVDRAILLALLGQVICQRDQAFSNCEAMISVAKKWENANRLRDLRDLQKKISDLHFVGVN